MASKYADWLSSGIHVVTPNKKAGSGDLSYYRKVDSVRRQALTHFLYETTVGAGLPIIETLRDLVRTGDHIIRLEGIFSGTLAYLFNCFDGKRAFSEIVLDARENGFTEPDPRDDLSGLDVARKLVILGREMGLSLSLSDIQVESLIPQGLEEGSVESFLDQLHAHDEFFLNSWAAAEAEGRVLRYVGPADPRRRSLSQAGIAPAGSCFRPHQSDGQHRRLHH